jgi:hypothetical protein
MSNANDRRQVEAATRREKGLRTTELDEVRWLMSEPLGRALAYRVLERTGAEAVVPFTANAMNLARDVGVQSVGFWLLGEIRAGCPEKETIMRLEAADRARRADLQDEVDNEHGN